MRDLLKKVVVTGAGCVTNIGFTVDEFCENLDVLQRNQGTQNEMGEKPVGFRKIENFSFYDTELLEKYYRLDVACQYILECVRQAFISAGLGDAEISGDSRIAVIIGTTFGLFSSQTRFLNTLYKTGKPSPILFRQTTNNLLSGIVSYKYKVQGMNFSLYNGWTSGLDAVMLGKELILNDSADIVIAGGVDIINEPVISNFKDTFNSMGSAKIIDGRFSLGEGAGVVILESERNAVKRNASMGGCIGQAKQYRIRDINCIEGVLRNIHIANEDSDKYFSNENGTDFDEYENRAVNLYFNKSEVIGIKRHAGEFGAASGILQIIYAAYLKGKSNIIVNICNSGRLSYINTQAL